MVTSSVSLRGVSAELQALLTMPSIPSVVPTSCTSPVKVAVLSRNEKNALCSLQYVHLDSPSPGPLDGVGKLHYIPDCRADIGPEDFYSGQLKTGSNHQQSLENVFQFLSGGVDADSKQELSVGSSMFVEELESPSSEWEKQNVSYRHFVETRISSKSASSEVLQFLNVGSTGRSLKAKDNMTAFDSIQVVTGMCLFSQEHLVHTAQHEGSSLPNGLTKPPLPTEQMLTVDEIESLVLLPNVVADITSVLPPHIPTSIVIDMPRVQYYAPLLDTYNAHRRRGDGHKLSAWFKVVDERYNMLSNVMRKAVEKALLKRGITRDNVSVQCSSGMGELIPAIKAIVSDGGRAPSIEEFLRLLHESDPLWAPFYDCVDPQSKPPKSINAVALMSYSFQLVRPVFQRLQKPYHIYDGRQLLLQIDSPREHMISLCAQNILKLFFKRYLSTCIIERQPPLLLAIFCSGRIFEIESSDDGATLTQGNDGHCLIEQETAGVLSSADIVAELHGREVTQTVLQLMQENNMFAQTYRLSSPIKVRRQ